MQKEEKHLRTKCCESDRDVSQSQAILQQVRMKMGFVQVQEGNSAHTSPVLVQRLIEVTAVTRSSSATLTYFRTIVASSMICNHIHTFIHISGLYVQASPGPGDS